MAKLGNPKTMPKTMPKTLPETLPKTLLKTMLKTMPKAGPKVGLILVFGMQSLVPGQASRAVLADHQVTPAP